MTGAATINAVVTTAFQRKTVLNKDAQNQHKQLYIKIKPFQKK